MTRDQIQDQLCQTYQRDHWLAMLKAILPGTEVFANSQPAVIDPKVARRAVQLGRVKLHGDRNLAVLEIEVVDGIDIIRNRVGLRNFIARFIDQALAHGVLAIFHSPKQDFRFTFAASETFFDAEGQLQRRETAARRFTYVLGPGEACRTPADRFAQLAAKGGAAELSDVIDAFSVEKLNKEFFDTYKQYYQKFCAHLIETDSLLRVFDLSLKGLDEKAYDRALKPARDFVKKLMGRLVFLHFLQKKGWLGCPPCNGRPAHVHEKDHGQDARATSWSNGDPAFLRNLFDTASEADRKRFHSHRLAPLFFDTLNHERKDDIFPITGTRVPYLNGGLFERDFDGVEKIDFPPELFAGLLEFFGHYNFTIDENDPDEQEIGIDPEMLGHIFENLLEDNKDKGAYYTPKAVVQYMCQQSLIHALAGRFRKSGSGVPPEALGQDAQATIEIERLIRRKEPIDPKKDTWLAKHATDLEKHLDDLHICDPAIGSGAFPIGLLQEIYWTKLTLHPALDRATIKRAIIQRSIHGVDLDAGAVEIARLRFWLALIVEETTPVPLPNLDYQIMQGNSLLESFEGIDLSRISQPTKVGITLLGSDQTEMGFGAPRQIEITTSSEPREDLAQMQEKYFLLHAPEAKAQLRRRIDRAILRAIDDMLEQRRELLEASLDNWKRELARKRKLKKDYEPTSAELKSHAAMETEAKALASKKATLHRLLENPRAERPFFLWHLWFRHILCPPPAGRGGFDIVIANPPYVRQESIKELKPALKAEPYECFDGVADLLVYFYECAVKKLRPGGVLTFITSNKFYRAGYGEALRGFLTRELTLHRLTDFGDAPVFDAIAYASILEGTRIPPTADASAQVYTWEKKMPLDDIATVVETEGQPILQKELTPDSWRLESPATLRLLEKLRRIGSPLGKYVEGRFYNGVKSGHTQAFVVDQATRDRLVKQHPASVRVFKPYLAGRDLKRWCVQSRKLWLIYIPWHFPLHEDTTITAASHKAEEEFKRHYPAIYKHLEQFKDELAERDKAETGVRYEWYAMARPRFEIHKAFEQPKIILGRFMNKPTYAFDIEGFYHNDAQYLIGGASPYLAAILNSEVCWWFLTHICTDLQNGYLQALIEYQEQIPIPAATAAEQAGITKLVDKILAAQRANDSATVKRLEQEIDTHVFRLYGLTADEIKTVKGAGK